MNNKPTEIQTAIPDYIDIMGFDNVLRVVAEYAERMAMDKGNKYHRRSWWRVVSTIADCADKVETLLGQPDSMSIALEQFEDTTND